MNNWGSKKQYNGSNKGGFEKFPQWLLDKCESPETKEKLEQRFNCQIYGGVINYVKDKEGLTFPKAVNLICFWCNIDKYDLTAIKLEMEKQKQFLEITTEKKQDDNIDFLNFDFGTVATSKEEPQVKMTAEQLVAMNSKPIDDDIVVDFEVKTDDTKPTIFDNVEKEEPKEEKKEEKQDADVEVIQDFDKYMEEKQKEYQSILKVQVKQEEVKQKTDLNKYIEEITQQGLTLKDKLQKIQQEEIDPDVPNFTPFEVQRIQEELQGLRIKLAQLKKYKKEIEDKENRQWGL